jgi:hypothetical protein
MAVTVEHALIGKDAVGGDKIIDFGGGDRAAGSRERRGTFFLHVRCVEFGVSGSSKITDSSAAAKSALWLTHSGRAMGYSVPS